MKCESCGSTKFNKSGRLCDAYGYVVEQRFVNVVNSRQVVVLLAFFGGIIGLDEFYLGYRNRGIIKITMFILAPVFFIGLIIFQDLITMVFIDYVKILIGKKMMHQEEFSSNICTQILLNIIKKI